MSSTPISDFESNDVGPRAVMVLRRPFRRLDSRKLRFLIRPSFIRYRSTVRLRRTSAFLSAGQFCLRVWQVSDTKRTIDVAIKRAAEAVAAHEFRRGPR